MPSFLLLFSLLTAVSIFISLALSDIPVSPYFLSMPLTPLFSWFQNSEIHFTNAVSLSSRHGCLQSTEVIYTIQGG